MLDKDLCEAFDIPPFLEWLMAQLDAAEDRVYANIADDKIKAAAKAEYETLKRVRDVYCEMR